MLLLLRYYSLQKKKHAVLQGRTYDTIHHTVVQCIVSFRYKCKGPLYQDDLHRTNLGEFLHIIARSDQSNIFRK